MKSNAWKKYNEEDMKAVFDYNKGYIAFMSKCKTERECVDESIAMAEAKGYKNLQEYIDSNTALKPGDKVYANNHGKTIALFLIGKEPTKKGIKILGAHIDSPRIDLKQVPLYEDHELAFLDTHYYGGIKKYQWVATPLALHGVICKTDGTVVNVNIGEDPSDPVVGISDLLIHLSREQMQKPTAKAIEGEALNVLVGSIPLEGEEKDAVKANILKLLKDKYDVEEDDLTSAEIECVPAGPARDYGIDRSMVLAYGHDDRVCAYTSLTAFLDIEEAPDRTVCCYLADKEEVGSTGNTGSNSNFFQDTIAEIVYLTSEKYSDILVKRCLKYSMMISSDVSVGFDPNYPSVCELKNTALLGYGICFNKYTGSGGKGGSNDANPEYYAHIRNIMDRNNISYQTGEIGAVDVGGGGTIAGIFAKMNMEVIDSGVPVQNMHAPCEVASKADIYEATKCYKAFLIEA